MQRTPFRLKTPICGLAMLIFCSSLSAAASKETPKPAPKDNGSAGGIVIDKNGDTLSVLVDGDDEPTKFLLGGTLDKKSQDALKTIFSVDRVQIRYKMDGDSRRVTGIDKVVGRAQGVVIGEVIKVYNDFWVAIKPKDGPPDGYALNGPPEKVKAAADVLKSLKKGDVVAIKYITDFERHRIIQIEVKPAGKK